MSKHKISSASQKSYFARFYLEAIENTEKDESLLNRKALTAAHQQSCLFFLVGAYRSFLWEVANTYDESYRADMSLEQLIQSARKKGKTLGELERIYNLESTPQSWLSRMITLWQKINELDPDKTSSQKGSANLNAIEVRVITDFDEFTQLYDWYDNLTCLIEEIRELLVEW